MLNLCLVLTGDCVRPFVGATPHGEYQVGKTAEKARRCTGNKKKMRILEMTNLGIQ